MVDIDSYIILYMYVFSVVNRGGSFFVAGELTCRF